MQKFRLKICLHPKTFFQFNKYYIQIYQKDGKCKGFE